MLAATQQAQSIGQLFATDASVKGSVMLAGSGTSVLSGSSIEAGTQAATLKLAGLRRHEAFDRLVAKRTADAIQPEQRQS